LLPKKEKNSTRQSANSSKTASKKPKVYNYTDIFMNYQKVLEKLNQISKVPKHGTKAYGKWVEQKEFLQFLLDTSSGEIPLYISFKETYIYSILLPQNVLKGDYVDDLMEWQCSPDSSWGYGYSFSKKGRPKNISISQPLDSAGSKLLKKATPITFSRHFDGRIERKSYVEVYQQLTHLHDLHFVEEKNAYCRINEDGDIEEVIKIRYPQDEIIVTIKQDVLDFHMFLAKSVLLRVFDRTICNDWIGFHEESRQESKFRDQKNEIYAGRGILFNKDRLPTASWLRGFQIIRNHQPRKKMIAILTGKSLEPKKYEKFIALDWKHDRIDECSCDPKKLGNYFIKSDKPFSTSPAFFKPEVLLKYKQNPEKYTLDQRHITCRNSWDLQTYDINEAGQVHTYLVYLGQLPYSEQLYWKAFNEKPKAGISKRAFKTDFKAEWDLSYEPLSELKKSLENLGKKKSKLWSCANEDLYRQLNYVVSDSLKEWENEIHDLDKLVIEGFNYSYLKKLSKSLECYSEELGSIKLLGEILKVKKINETGVNEMINPLEEIHFLRTKFVGHSSGAEANKIREELILKYGDLKSHFRDLLKRTDKAVKLLLEASL